MKSLPTYTIQSLGDAAAVISFGNLIDKEINDLVLFLFHHFKRKKHPAIIDIVPAYSSLSFFYDVIKLRSMEHHKSAYETIRRFIEDDLGNDLEYEPLKPRTIRIPVCYEGLFSPDIKLIAAEKNISVEEIVRVHTQTKYSVYMIGFLAGFPYMGIVDEAIAFPRKHQPRSLIPAGSVGIAGQQTGIYPMNSPGGWQIIGRTPLKVFDKEKENPVWLQPGDEVEFYSITEDEFKNY